MATIKHNSDGGPDGTLLGQSSTDKIAFYGATPIVRPTSASQAAITTTAITAPVTTVATSSAPFGFTEAQANSIVAAVRSLIVRVDAQTTFNNQARTDLIALGLIAGS